MYLVLEIQSAVPEMGQQKGNNQSYLLTQNEWHLPKFLLTVQLKSKKYVLAERIQNVSRKKYEPKKYFVNWDLNVNHIGLSD